jgi:hypothetical protein
MDRKTLFWLAIVAVGCTQAVHGNVIPIGTSGAPDVFTGQSAGTAIATLLDSFSVGATSGTLRETVFRETGGTLDFYYQVNVTATASAVNFLNVFGYTGFPNADEGYRTDGGSLLPPNIFFNGGVIPTSVFRATDRIAFTITGVGTSQSSSVLEVQTAATTFGSAVALVAGGDGQTDNLAALAPIATAPEPTSIFLTGGGLLAIAGLSRRRASR